MKWSEIRRIVNRAIDNICIEGCTDVSVFGFPFEINGLKNKVTRENISQDIVNSLDEILNHNGKFEVLKMNKITHMLVPKKTYYDFRKCALIDIIDEIKMNHPIDFPQ